MSLGSKKDRIRAMLADLEGFRKIGETFNFLGATCVVTGYVWSTLEESAILFCDYRDGYGVIREHQFSHHELPGLRNQNPEVTKNN